MRIAFLGTPDVAVPALEAFIAADDVEVAAVITNPDRAKGRSKRPVPPPVKVAAEAAGIEVWQPGRPREILDDLRALEVDACAVVAYGSILPADVLEAGGRGMVNLHFSLLPRWRGAAPVQHALRAGDTVTGVTTFVLDPGMDTGPVLARHEVTIEPDESAGDLLDRLAVVGAPILVGSVRRLVAGEQPTPQDETGATLAPKIAPEDVALRFEASAREVADLARSADPAPGAHTRFRGKRFKVYRVTVVDPATLASPDGTDPAATDRGTADPGATDPGATDPGATDPGATEPGAAFPGTVIATGRTGVVVACGEGAVRLESVQPEGKARMDGPGFANGYQPEVGERLGAPVPAPTSPTDGTEDPGTAAVRDAT